MIARCHNPKHDQYENYGKRGIRVCKRWRKFENFLEDMGHRPSGTTIDRIESDGDYEPFNCRWLDRWGQANNTSRNVFVEFRGRRQTVAEWARERRIHVRTLRKRLAAGWPVEQAFQRKKKIKKKV